MQASGVQQHPGRGTEYGDHRCSQPGVSEEEREASVAAPWMKRDKGERRGQKGKRAPGGGPAASASPVVRHTVCELGSQLRGLPHRSDRI